VLAAALGEAAWHSESYGTGAMDTAQADKRISKQRIVTVTSAAERDAVWVSKLYILWYWLSRGKEEIAEPVGPLLSQPPADATNARRPFLTQGCSRRLTAANH
jgi:hypothetical protein